MNNGLIVKSEPVRAYIYRVATALFVVLVAIGKISDNDVPMYLGLIAAILGLPLAVVNTSTKKEIPSE